MAHLKGVKTNRNLKIFSSLNNYFVCDYCARKFPNKPVLIAHIKNCLEDRTCKFCRLVFRNRGNLVSHLIHMHKKSGNDLLNTSCSLNKYYMCDYCSRKFQNKATLITHLESCLENRTCKWCDLVFKNRGNLVTHAYHIHGDESVKKTQNDRMMCKVCDKVFSEYFRLKHHIRSVHFNLQPIITLRDSKKINQVWFEEVLNTNDIAQIKKTGNNVLLIRRFDSNKPVKLLKREGVADLRDKYPTYASRKQIQCDVCKLSMLKRDFKLHYQERHTQNKKHQCNNCKATFKRSYFFVRHVCK